MTLGVLPFRASMACRMVFAALVWVLMAGGLLAQTVTATIPAGTNPCVVAVNPVTHKIYAANYSSNNVTVIDGATNATTTLAQPARIPAPLR